MSTPNNLLAETYIPYIATNGGFRTNKPVYIAGDLTVTGTTTIGGITLTDLTVTGNTVIGDALTDTLTVTGATTIRSTSATAFTVGAAASGATPAFSVDASTSSQVTGLKVVGAASGGTVAVAVTQASGNANLSIDAIGTGTVTINGTATGNIVLGRATTGVSVSLTGGYTAKSATAVPASADALAAGAAFTFFSGGNAIWITSDAPAFSATKGDLCINTGGSSSSTRLFINDGTTNWVAVTTAS